DALDDLEELLDLGTLEVADAAGAHGLERPTDLLAVAVAEVLRRQLDSLLHGVLVGVVVRVVLVVESRRLAGVLLEVILGGGLRLLSRVVLLGLLRSLRSLLGPLRGLLLGALPGRFGLLLVRHPGATGAALLRGLLLLSVLLDTLALGGLAGGLGPLLTAGQEAQDLSGLLRVGDFDLDLHMSFLSNTSCGP